MANVETTPAIRRKLARELRATGIIQYSEAALATITARVDGYAERLFVDYTGIEIKAGDHLAEIYSPELLVAQDELLTALHRSADTMNESLAGMARKKLQRWGLTREQIDELIESNTIADRITLYSPIEGTVIEKSIVQNSSFKSGDALYRIANLDTVWVYLDVYEVDLPWLRYGQHVEIIAEAFPGRLFEGRVTFIQPFVTENTRTVRVPVHIENKDHALKPGMYVSAVIHSVLGRDGQAAYTGVEGKYSCPMHPEVLVEQPGQCPVCEMPLEQIPGLLTTTTGAPVQYYCTMKCEGEKTYDEPGNCPVCEMAMEPAPAATPGHNDELIAVPASAVLDSGTRRLVFVEESRGLFEAREVLVGPRAAGFFPVLKGLEEGERVVTRGGFLIDSQFQINGLPSLFYPGGLMAGQTAHQHGGVLPAEASPSADTSTKAIPSSGSAAPHQH